MSGGVKHLTDPRAAEKSFWRIVFTVKPTGMYLGNAL